MIAFPGSKLWQKILLLCIFILCVDVLYGQDQNIADSLTIVYESGNFKEGNHQELLSNLVQYHTDPQKIFNFSEKLVEAAELSGSIEFLIKGYLGIGTALRMMGDIPDALENFFKASEIASENQMKEQLGLITVNIADAYSIIENHSLAISHYNKGIQILREQIRDQKDSLRLALSLNNLGDEYFNYGKLDSALFIYLETGKLFEDLSHEQGTAYNLGNIGQVYAQLGQYEKAEINLNQAIRSLTELGDLYPISVYLLSLSDIYLVKDKDTEALHYAEQSLQLAQKYGLKDQISDADLKLSEIYEKMGEPDKAISYYKMHIIYRDSLKSLAAVEEVANLRTQFEVAQKQTEVDLLTKEAEIADLRDRRQGWVIFGTVLSLVLVAVLAVATFRRYRFVQETNRIIEEEKNRSEDLLLNILPEETALELKLRGKVKARKIEGVTVLFTDFIEFSRLAEQVAPEQMVQSIDYYFKQFDEITTRYNLEKIKTIGDSYMCAGGLHSESSQAIEVIKAAIEMIAVTDNAKPSQKDIIHFDMRIGINTGPVVAGIVGTKKWQYDIWGDTVNIASGMESNSISTKVNISESTYQEVKDEFEVEYRGEIEIKNRGPVKMYFIS